MQRALPLALVLLAICAGIFAWVQHSENASLRSQLAAVTRERDEAQATAAKSKESSESAIENISRLTAERDAALERAKGAGIPSAPPGFAPPPPKSGANTGGSEMMKGIAKMFDTEDGRKMMRSQMAMGIKMLYGNLAKDLNLDPGTADQVMALLADRQAAVSEMTFSLMKDGTLDEESMKAVAAKSKELNKEYDGKLTSLVGSDGLKKLNDYERTANDRMMLTMQEQQFTAVGAPLDESQRESLMQIMKEERLKTPSSAFEAGNQNDPAKAFNALKDEAAVEKWVKQEEDYQRRVLDAAPSLLNPDQVMALRNSFKQQTELQRFGMKMSKEMFRTNGTTTNESAAKTTPVAPAGK